ncbi:MAG: hypothetical protein JSR60_04985 [Proteobacteria bacterium]|nr:hypothetical protein [Pseudomonadota bacterium]
MALLPAAAKATEVYTVRYDHWSAGDEEAYGAFVQAIGDANCGTVDRCLHSAANPYRFSDPPDIVFDADCADFIYLLRAYFAWKRNLPFSYSDGVAPRGRSGDIRYSPGGNRITGRRDLASGASFTVLFERMRQDVSSADFRVHPDLDTPEPPDTYPVAIRPGSIRPGTLIYDPNGHVAVVFRVDPDGRIHFLDSHTDFSLARSIYDRRFIRTEPGAGAGFRNWRPQTLVGATRQADGTLTGGHVVLARNADIPDYSTEQYFGTGARPADADWANGAFVLNGETIDYYDYVRARLSTGGNLLFDPLKDVHEMVSANCSDLQYRAQAVDIAIAAGMARRPEPPRLPMNIYGTDGDWEMFSTPSRDARLKTAFKELRDSVERYVTMYVRGGDPHLSYLGDDMVGDMLAIYRRDTAACTISYTRSDGSKFSMSYEEARHRLFAMSFDPYQCPERRWGATDPTELSTCRDDADKRDWYLAERKLRNQIDRTYEARMDFSAAELASPGAGKGVEEPPDIDVLGYLMRVRDARPGKSAGF